MAEPLPESGASVERGKNLLRERIRLAKEKLVEKFREIKTPIKKALDEIDDLLNASITSIVAELDSLRVDFLKGTLSSEKIEKTLSQIEFTGTGFFEKVQNMLRNIREKSYLIERSGYLLKIYSDSFRGRIDNAKYFMNELKQNIQRLEAERSRMRLKEKEIYDRRSLAKSGINQVINIIDKEIKREKGPLGVMSLISGERKRKINELIEIKRFLIKLRDYWFSKPPRISQEELDSLNEEWRNIRSNLTKVNLTWLANVMFRSHISVDVNDNIRWESYFITSETTKTEEILEKNVKESIEKFLSQLQNINMLFLKLREELKELDIYVQREMFEWKKEKIIHEIVREVILPEFYKELGIDQESEEKWLQEQREDVYKKIFFHESLYELFKRSFENIRKSVELFLLYYLKEIKDLNELEAVALTLIKELREEIDSVKQSLFIVYYDDDKDFEYYILPEGRIKPLSEVSKSRTSIMKKAGAGSAEFVYGYHWKRKEVAQTLYSYPEALYNVVHCILANESEPSPPAGRAQPGSQYGNIQIIIDLNKIGSSVMFIEGDSLNAFGVTPSLRSEEKLSNPKARQLALIEHAIISKAIYNLDRRKKPHEVFKIADVSAGLIETGLLHYIEVHIPGGFDLSQARKIRIDLANHRYRLSTSDVERLRRKIKERYPEIEVEIIS
jgi:hypothetical protein